MVTAIDSSVLFDVITVSAEHFEPSGAALMLARRNGSLIVCETVIAEISPPLGRPKLEQFLADWQIQFVGSSLESALTAGEFMTRYFARVKKVRRVVPDFLIGAHALVHADRLLARDRGYFRDYFRGLKLMEP